MNKSPSEGQPDVMSKRSTQRTSPVDYPVRPTIVMNRLRSGTAFRFLGPQMFLGEMMIYAMLESICDEYGGGHWEFYALNNGGFYMVPSTEKPLRITVRRNGFDAILSAQSAGIVATLRALNHLFWKTRSEDCCHRYALLQEYARGQPEADLILQASA